MGVCPTAGMRHGVSRTDPLFQCPNSLGNVTFEPPAAESEPRDPAGRRADRFSTADRSWSAVQTPGSGSRPPFSHPSSSSAGPGHTGFRLFKPPQHRCEGHAVIPQGSFTGNRGIPHRL
ncbi:hypothetical protein Q5P01_001701 [Channa striata]|uniref:Uncharacterized protein n=1 Tax=Channa striata TaxID=64152 RepID=A0AA88NRW9_CHASR|nr:hypothetical protein Q5P01_001701 [Channa striata]